MNIKDLCINKKESLLNAMKLIDKSGINIAFITYQGTTLLGVITDSDIRRALMKGSISSDEVQSVMNKNPVKLKENWTQEDIKNIIRQESIKTKMLPHSSLQLPVLNEHDKLVDIVFISSKGYEGSYINKIKPRTVKSVLVVGGAGYLGSVLCEKLIKEAYHVKVLDNLMYGDDGLKKYLKHPNFEFIKGDMRNIGILAEAVKGVDAVIDLAAIVGDEACLLDPQETITANYFATKTLAEMCKYYQINRFIFASSCSVYGATKNPNNMLKESSDVSPVSLYGKMKLHTEGCLLELEDENFAPTIFRMATLFGLSDRMRFDLVANILTAKAYFEKKITVFGGEQWRPLLHINDAADAYIACLKAPLNKVKGEIFNVGSSSGNYQIKSIANIIKQFEPKAEILTSTKDIDARYYNVDFEKINSTLDFNPSILLTKGTYEIKKEFEKGRFKDYKDKKYSNVASLKDGSTWKN